MDVGLDKATLIDLVRQFPHSWDKKERLHSNQVAVENAWTSISDILKITAQEYIEAWKVVRTRYIKERNGMKKLPSGSGSYICKWPYFSLCQFLDPAIAVRRTKGKFKVMPTKLYISKPHNWSELLSESSQQFEEMDEEINTEHEIVIYVTRPGNGLLKYESRCLRTRRRRSRVWNF